MYYFKVWVGSITFAFGVAGIVWFIRNLFRSRINRARGFYEHKFLFLAISIIFIIGGLWIYSNFQLMPLIGFLVGILIGWWISR